MEQRALLTPCIAGDDLVVCLEPLAQVPQALREPGIYGQKPLAIYAHSDQVLGHLEAVGDPHRVLKEPEFVYVARQGARFDGHQLAMRIVQAGHIFVGSVQRRADMGLVDSGRLIFVDDTQQALALLLRKSYGIVPEAYHTTAVTGTNGKTSVVHMVGQLLQALGAPIPLKIGTLGAQRGDWQCPLSHVTTPDYPSFLAALAWAQQYGPLRHIVLEYTSHGLQEKRLRDWPIQVAIFTNFTQDHLDFHKTMDHYRQAKLTLFHTCLAENGTAVINTDAPDWPVFLEAARGPKRSVVLCGAKSVLVGVDVSHFARVSELVVHTPQATTQGIEGMLSYQNGEQPSVPVPFVTPLFGDFQRENLLCAMGALLAQGYPLQRLCEALSDLGPVPGRLQKVSAAGDPLVLVDYAHTPDALQKALLACRGLAPQGKVIVVFGCGGDRDADKRPQMGLVACTYADIVVVTSDNPRTEDPLQILDQILAPLARAPGLARTPPILRQPDRRMAIQTALVLAQPADVVLVAGKGHEMYQIVGTERHPFSDADVIRSLLKHTS